MTRDHKRVIDSSHPYGVGTGRVCKAVLMESVKKKNGYRILINADSELGKTDRLLNLLHQQPVTDQIYLYAKD